MTIETQQNHKDWLDKIKNTLGKVKDPTKVSFEATEATKEIQNQKWFEELLKKINEYKERWKNFWDYLMDNVKDPATNKYLMNSQNTESSEAKNLDLSFFKKVIDSNKEAWSKLLNQIKETNNAILSQGADVVSELKQLNTVVEERIGFLNIMLAVFVREPWVLILTQEVKSFITEINEEKNILSSAWEKVKRAWKNASTELNNFGKEVERVEENFVHKAYGRLNKIF
jgi:hypothetical protein